MKMLKGEMRKKMGKEQRQDDGERDRGIEGEKVETGKRKDSSQTGEERGELIAVGPKHV